MTENDDKRRFSEFDLLTVREAAELLRCSESTVRRAVRDGSLIWFRVRPHGGIRIPAFGLERFIAPHLLRAAYRATAATSEEVTP